MTAGLASDLRRLLTPEQVLDSAEDRFLYAYDATSTKVMPDVVVFARSAQDVSAVMKYATEHGVPVGAPGAGSGSRAVRSRRGAASRCPWPR